MSCMTQTAPACLWRISTEGPIPVRCWDGEYAVFNPLSGDTHLLDIVAGKVLETIIAGAVSTSHLSTRIAEFLNLPDDTNLQENIGAILASLDELGLIEPVEGC